MLLLLLLLLLLVLLLLLAVEAQLSSARTIHRHSTHVRLGLAFSMVRLRHAIKRDAFKRII